MSVTGGPWATGTCRFSQLGIAVGPGDGATSDELLSTPILRSARQKRGQRHIPLLQSLAGEARAASWNSIADSRARRRFSLFPAALQPDPAAAEGFRGADRWNHRNTVGSALLDIIPLAEETGLIVPIGEWVICATPVVRQGGGVARRSGGGGRYLPAQFGSPVLAQTIVQALAASGPARQPVGAGGIREHLHRQCRADAGHAAQLAFAGRARCARRFWYRLFPRSAICARSRSTSSRSTRASCAISAGECQRRCDRPRHRHAGRRARDRERSPKASNWHRPWKRCAAKAAILDRQRWPVSRPHPDADVPALVARLAGSQHGEFRRLEHRVPLPGALPAKCGSAGPRR